MASNRRARKARKSTVETRREEEFLFRGRTIEELQAMSMEDLLPLLPARPRRRLTRGLSDVEKAFIAKVEAAEEGEPVRTHLRSTPILPSFVGKDLAVHNGREFTRVTITPEMIGHYVGEFAPTRKFGAHTGPGVGATRSSKYMPLK